MLVRSILSIVVLVACRSSQPTTPSDERDAVVGDHHVSITIPQAEVAAQTKDRITWRVPAGEATVSDDGPQTGETKFLIARSPRTIVRSDGGFHVVTEVVRECDGRVFGCVYTETVADPESPAGHAARDRGVAARSEPHAATPRSRAAWPAGDSGSATASV